MAALTSSSSQALNGTRPRGNAAATLSALLGTLAVLAIPGAIAASRYVPRVQLLEALYAGVPAAVVLGLLALGAGRRAQRKAALTLGRAGGEGTARVGRWLALLGLYLGCTGALALGFYAVLRGYS